MVATWSSPFLVTVVPAGGILSQHKELRCRSTVLSTRSQDLGFCKSVVNPQRQPALIRGLAPGGGRKVKTPAAAPTDQDVMESGKGTEKSSLLSKDVEGDKLEAEPFDWKAAILAFVFPALGGLLFGYDIGATSGALVSLKDPVLSGTNWYDLSATATGLVVSGSLGGALVGSGLAFGIADYLGRRRELLVAAALYFAGAGAMTSAPSLVVLVLGHIIFGVGIGLAMHAAPMYIAETSPSKIRGTLISLKEVFIVIGILLGYVAGNLCIDVVGGWRIMFGASLPVAALMALGMFFLLPPSPRWLLLRAGQAEDTDERSVYVERAKESFKRLRGSAADQAVIAAEVDELLEGQEDVKTKEEGFAAFTELFKGTSLQALVVGGGLVLFQQITGQPSVLYYAASILQDAGFAAASDATGVAVYLGLFKLVMTAIAVLFVDKAGRRPLLLIGVSGIVVSLVSLGTYYATGGASPFLSVASLLLYVGAYQVSFGPISWLMVSEVFPLSVRGRAQSVATVINFGANAVVTFAFPPIQVALGQAGTFFTFAVIGLAALAFVFFKVPETKGLTLEQIESVLVKPTSTEEDH
eukprot:TRINITY_DN1598_c0_g1_i1.p1 TRINITY_DN1598_c0_g1~~TRINITY_DN1598_c0_g1_i1.p1  ORF type:complete len:583 (+),score=96.72 TRINITY_DN1598_c0_g1_i1:28-1776(+)